MSYAFSSANILKIGYFDKGTESQMVGNFLRHSVYLLKCSQSME